MLIPLVCLMAVASASDPTCKTGIEHDTTICCAKSCGRCGGTGCENLPGGPDSCCAGQIKKNGKSCATSDPPCNTVPSVQYALVLDAAPPASKQLFHNHSWPSWGGTIVRGTANDSHPYHLFAASFANGCGLYGWIRNGIVIHATASTPAGPYTFHDVALPVFQHNPHAVKHPDGTYLLFGIGQANNASWECPCHDGRPIMPDGKPATDADAAPIDHAQLHISRSPYGPWENVMGPNGRDYLFETNNANPAPWIFKNGSLIVVTCQFDVWYADHYRSEYKKIGRLPFIAMNAARNDSVARQLTHNFTCQLTIEDPYIMYDEPAAVWRVLMHQYLRCPAHAQDLETQADGLSLVGGYAVSETSDLFGAWRYDFAKPAYGTAVSFTDGHSGLLAGRERPKIFFDDDGKPSLLTNGVRPSMSAGGDKNVNEMGVFTFVQPIDRFAFDILDAQLV